MSLVAPERGYEGLSGRTLHAIRLTLEDMGHELALQASSSGELSAAPTLRTGGLRAGWAELTSTGLSLHGLSYVPGLMISGSIKDETADLLITGPSAAHGTLRLGRRDALVGTLGGRHVELVANRDATAAIVARDAQASSNSRAGGSAGADVARNLAELLGGLHP
jgi:hypothetical protein